LLLTRHALPPEIRTTKPYIFRQSYIKGAEIYTNMSSNTRNVSGTADDSIRTPLAPPTTTNAFTSTQVSADQENIAKALKKRLFGGKFKLDVGGTVFCTTRDTLVGGGSEFFAAALSGNFAGGLEGDCDNGEPFYVDRSPVTFSILLEYMRTGVLLCPDRNLLAAVLLEAEYYMMTALLEDVKSTCYINLNLPQPVRSLVVSEENIQNGISEKFPTIRDVLLNKYFPGIYYEKIIPNMVLSTTMLPEPRFVQITPFHEREENEYQFTQMVTYKHSGNKIVTEPLIRFESFFIPWVEIDFMNPDFYADDWPEVSEYSEGEMPVSQLVPLSFVLKYHIVTPIGLTSWRLFQKVIVHNAKGANAQSSLFSYISNKTNGILDTYEANYLEYRFFDNGREKAEIIRYAFDTDNKSYDVSTRM
jgi:hypothetical protein